jgi:hypothetical protein
LISRLPLLHQHTPPTARKELNRIHAKRFELMSRLAQLPPDPVFVTQITSEAARIKARLSASIGYRASARQSKSVA